MATVYRCDRCLSIMEKPWQLVSGGHKWAQTGGKWITVQLCHRCTKHYEDFLSGHKISTEILESRLR